MGATGHEVIASPLGGRPSQDGSFNIKKALIIEIAPNTGGNPRAHHQILLHLRSTKIHVAVFESYILTHRLVCIEWERRRRGAAEQFKLLAKDLNLSCGHRRIDGRVAARSDTTRNFEHVLTAHLVRQSKRLFSIGIKHHLNNALSIPHVEKYHTTMIAPPIHPPAEGDGFVDQGLCD